MSNERIRSLLDELRQELENTDIDDATRNALSQFDDQLHQQASGDGAASDVESGVAIPVVAEGEEPPDLLERAKELEVMFATRHPLAERMMQEIVGILSRMGI